MSWFKRNKNEPPLPIRTPAWRRAREAADTLKSLTCTFKSGSNEIRVTPTEYGLLISPKHGGSVSLPWDVVPELEEYIAGSRDERH